MGKPYEAAFCKGERVKIASSDALAQFRRTWRFHHKLVEEQLSFADQIARVESTGSYHGGDMLYWLEGIPGTWHECCLTKVSD